MSNKPKYCKVCKDKLLKTEDVIPDCTECEFLPPEPLKQNRLFLSTINDCYYSRDINGRLDFGVYLRVLDLYSDVMELDSGDKLELLRKAQFITSLEEDRRNEDKIPIGEGKKKKTNVKTIGSGKKKG